MQSHGAGARGEMLTGTRLMANDCCKELKLSVSGARYTPIKFQEGDLSCPKPFL